MILSTRFFFVSLSLLAFLTFSCKSSASLDGGKAPLASPPVKRITTYKIHTSDEEGSLLESRFFNEKGQLVKIFFYDFYGSEEIEDSTAYSYNEQGQKVKEIAYGNSTTTTYIYDEFGRLKEESWSRPNGQGSTGKNTYNASGDLVETRYYDANGDFDFSRTYELGYDRKGRVISEKKWEKYGDGSADLLLYHMEYAYNAVDSLISKERFSEEGKVDMRTEYTYDDAGRLVGELEISISEDEEERTKIIYHFNKAGQEVKNDNFSIYQGKESLNYTNSYRYDKYGHQVWMMYEHADGGDAWGERRVYEYY